MNPECPRRVAATHKLQCARVSYDDLGEETDSLIAELRSCAASGGTYRTAIDLVETHLTRLATVYLADEPDPCKRERNFDRLSSIATQAIRFGRLLYGCEPAG